MANELGVIRSELPSMNQESIDKIRFVESLNSKHPQVEINTSHIIHGGMYARTIFIPAGVLLTGALIKIATILIIQGDVVVYIGKTAIELNGYNVFPARSNRKQAFATKTDVYLTMIFPSKTNNIEEAESEFTDEIDMLISRKNSMNNEINITGE